MSDFILIWLKKTFNVMFKSDFAEKDILTWSIIIVECPVLDARMVEK